MLARRLAVSLKTLLVSIGDSVKKDQLLGVIDPEQAENQIKEVEATPDGAERGASAGGRRVETGAGHADAPAAVG
ncbi:Macrolide-specific efflux protein MacA [Salmonella enterica subsp. arizonae]|uniref:Macrolide-specific efflux protein MacA n=1 Tax=Salmonella enterica subsp. arizonae TaxID=59203 RepID=A0A379S4Z7_SALER|nr:Macrolide-specific efflux protein MacA [Salmonella enterica subsp. arizonae]